MIQCECPVHTCIISPPPTRRSSSGLFLFRVDCECSSVNLQKVAHVANLFYSASKILLGFRDQLAQRLKPSTGNTCVTFLLHQRAAKVLSRGVLTSERVTSPSSGGSWQLVEHIVLRLVPDRHLHKVP